MEMVGGKSNLEVVLEVILMVPNRKEVKCML